MNRCFQHQSGPDRLGQHHQERQLEHSMYYQPAQKSFQTVKKLIQLFLQLAGLTTFSPLQLAAIEVHTKLPMYQSYRL